MLRSPLPAAGAIVLQCAGWFLQLLAVYVAMRAFDIHAPLPAAGLVLLLMNVATIFPLWPGNIGLLFLAREGLSFATLREMPDASEFPVDAESPPAEAARARAGVSG